MTLSASFYSYCSSKPCDFHGVSLVHCSAMSHEDYESQIDFEALKRAQAERVYDWQKEQEARANKIKDDNEKIFHERMLQKKQETKIRKIEDSLKREIGDEKKKDENAEDEKEDAKPKGENAEDEDEDEDEDDELYNKGESNTKKKRRGAKKKNHEEWFPRHCPDCGRGTFGPLLLGKCGPCGLWQGLSPASLIV